MNKQHAIETLKQLKGQPVTYHGRSYHISDIIKVDGQFRLITDSSDIRIDASELAEEIEAFELPETAVSSEPNPMAQIYENDRNQMDNLEKLLMDNIEKIQNDPKYLPQAKQVTNNVNTLLNMNKQKIEMVKELRRQREQ